MTRLFLFLKGDCFQGETAVMSPRRWTVLGTVASVAILLGSLASHSDLDATPNTQMPMCPAKQTIKGCSDEPASDCESFYYQTSNTTYETCKKLTVEGRDQCVESLEKCTKGAPPLPRCPTTLRRCGENSNKEACEQSYVNDGGGKGTVCFFEIAGGGYCVTGRSSCTIPPPPLKSKRLLASPAHPHQERHK